MKSCLAIHDLSCHASSSLNVVMPVLSSAGIDLSVLPCALLSSQSDGFEGLYVRNLEEEAGAIMKVWMSYGLSFDGLYSGYLADESQGEIVMEARRRLLNGGALIVTDPVMGDAGALYQNLGRAHVELMRSLLAGSSFATPNLTEACLLLDREQPTAGLSVAEAEDIARGVCSLGCSNAVVTSVPLKGSVLANIACDGSTCRVFPFDYVEASYPGSGDLFASLLVAQLYAGESSFVSVMKATRLASLAMRRTYASRRERREGVMVHSAIAAMLEEGPLVR